MNPPVCPHRKATPLGTGMDVRTKEDAPRFACASAHFGNSVSFLVVAAFSYQYTSPPGALVVPTEVEEILASFQLPGGPTVSAAYRRDVDTRTKLETQTVLGYWLSKQTFHDWKGLKEVSQWIGGQKALGDVGYFHEVAFFPPERWESIIAGSAGNHYPGIAVLAKNSVDEASSKVSLSEKIVHDYLGSMRDRIPISVSDPLDSSLDKLDQIRKSETRGKSIKVIPPPNIAVTYASQNWAATVGEEREIYEKKIAPVLAKGLAHLNTHPIDSNCVSARLLLDLDGTNSVGLAFFLSLADLEHWGWNHTTHGAVYNTFKLDYVMKGRANLKISHEIGVTPQNDLDLLYVNCHEDTGFLPFFEHHQVEAL